MLRDAHCCVDGMLPFFLVPCRMVSEAILIQHSQRTHTERQSPAPVQRMRQCSSQGHWKHFHRNVVLGHFAEMPTTGQAGLASALMYLESTIMLVYIYRDKSCTHHLFFPSSPRGTLLCTGTKRAYMYHMVKVFLGPLYVDHVLVSAPIFCLCNAFVCRYQQTDG